MISVKDWPEMAVGKVREQVVVRVRKFMPAVVTAGIVAEEVASLTVFTTSVTRPDDKPWVPSVACSTVRKLFNLVPQLPESPPIVGSRFVICL